MKFFKKILFVILIVSVFVVTRLLIQDVKPLFKNLVNETIANPLDKDFLTEEFEGLTIRYEKDDYATVETIKTLYPDAKEELDKLYGSHSDELTIVVYAKLEDFNAASDSEILGGYYTPINDSIHLKSEEVVGDFELEDTFFHEYAHYRTNRYIDEHGILEEDLPQWFNEGISEVIAKKNTSVDKDSLETIDFKELDSNTLFLKGRQGNIDPYLQSYFTVNELVHQFGPEIVPKVLLALKDSDIYKALDDLTGTSSEELLSNSLDRSEQINDLLEKASEYAVNGAYKETTNIYQEILRIEPNNYIANTSLSHFLVKQYKFTDAVSQLTNMEVLESFDLQLLAELSLLSDLNDSLKYMEMSEEKNKTKFTDNSSTSPFVDAIRNNIDDPVSAYLQLFKENLITYKEIESQVKVNLKKMYPDDSRVQNL
ncbi:hypothetical protein [Robertmurraya kyonggiensis]|uniref:Peptidase MA-like domain-containing protein n=1 Tax=Robertmurraya kyonggiensis TaxID=1037680 RepID=A0A4U1D9D7_9BACI|nr:hypothetical protein [Robertmurraya kyonggiensis]TKC19044.1 hypothetical protein FA727_05730 [Robertmurraya kyonggiensis]